MLLLNRPLAGYPHLEWIPGFSAPQLRQMAPCICVDQHGRQGLKAHELIALRPWEACTLATLLLAHHPDGRSTQEGYEWHPLQHLEAINT